MSMTATEISSDDGDGNGDGNVVRSIDISGKKDYNYEYEEGRIVRATEADIELNGEVVTAKDIIPATGFSDITSLENSRTGTTGYYIICKWNDADLITYGAHFYAVRDNGTKLNAYNGPSGQFDNFSQMLSNNNGGGLIYAYRIG